MEDTQSSGEESVVAEVEIHDIPFWMEAVSLKIQEIEAATAFLKLGVQRIADLTKEQDNLNLQREAENPQATLDTSFNTEKLTPTAKRLIGQLADGPLEPNKFEDFLMEKIFGKPRPPVLPIVRGYTSDIRGLCWQLGEFRRSLKQAHREYMTTHKKDENLDKRILRLMENIEQELTAEERDGRHQMSMSSFIVPRNEM